MLKKFFKYFVFYIFISGLQLQGLSLEPTATMRTEGIFLVQLLEQFHYSKKKVKSPR